MKVLHKFSGNVFKGEFYQGIITFATFDDGEMILIAKIDLSHLVEFQVMTWAKTDNLAMAIGKINLRPRNWLI